MNYRNIDIFYEEKRDLNSIFDLSISNVKKIADTYHSWRTNNDVWSLSGVEMYQDELGFCKADTRSTQARLQVNTRHLPRNRSRRG